MKKVLVLLVAMTMMSCSTDECTHLMSKCDDSIGQCEGTPIEVSCDIEDGTTIGKWTYRTIKINN